MTAARPRTFPEWPIHLLIWALLGVASEVQRLVQGVVLFTGVFVTQGCIMVKAGLRLQGRGNGRLRCPMTDATEAEIAGLVDSLESAGLPSGRSW